MTGNLFPGLDESLAESAAESQEKYELKILKKLYGKLYDDKALRHARVEAKEDFGLRWFNDEGLIPIILNANKKIKVNPIHLLRASGFTATEVYQAYMPEAKSLGRPFALVFPVIRVTQYVIHNALDLPVIPGWNYVTRLAKTSRDVDVRIETLEAFLMALGQVYGE